MLHEYLSHGSGNAVSAADLSKTTGLTPREIRRTAERERLAGHLILSDDSGYYLPSEDPALARMEITRWMAKCTATAGTILQTVEMARKILERDVHEPA